MGRFVVLWLLLIVPVYVLLRIRRQRHRIVKSLFWPVFGVLLVFWTLRDVLFGPRVEEWNASDPPDGVGHGVLGGAWFPGSDSDGD